LDESTTTETPPVAGSVPHASTVYDVGYGLGLPLVLLRRLAREILPESVEKPRGRVVEVLLDLGEPPGLVADMGEEGGEARDV
jgi:hypothetical protein